MSVSGPIKPERRGTGRYVSGRIGRRRSPSSGNSLKNGKGLASVAVHAVRLAPSIFEGDWLNKLFSRLIFELKLLNKGVNLLCYGGLIQTRHPQLVAWSRHRFQRVRTQFCRRQGLAMLHRNPFHPRTAPAGSLQRRRERRSPARECTIEAKLSHLPRHPQHRRASSTLIPCQDRPERPRFEPSHRLH